MLIETFADVVCPWCYIGRHRLSRALAERPRIDAEIRWQAFQLNPDMPRAGMDRQQYMIAKFGGLDRARQIYGVVEETAARDGLPLALHRIRRTPNTFDAHRVIRMAARRGRGSAMTDALFRAYFLDGHDLGDRETLSALAETAGTGLAAAEVRAALDTDAEVTAVHAADSLARQLGLQAVPCYIFNRRYALSGAQEPASFLPLLDLALDEVPAGGAAAD